MVTIIFSRSYGYKNDASLKGKVMNSFLHQTNKTISTGFPEPQGATLTEDGVNFAVYSRYADKVFLLLFDNPHSEPTDIIQIANKTGSVWHVFVHGVKAGQFYGYKFDGKYDPTNGYRFNKYKCLIDPYSRAISGKFFDQEYLLYGFEMGVSEKDLIMDKRDNTTIVPKSIVIDQSYDWQDDRRPKIALKDLIIYEVHLKGFTAHPSSDVKHPGTYLGFIEKIPYLKELGINAVELLPIHEFYTHKYLIQKGLTNYWGYDTIGFFAPESSYGTGSLPGCQVNEFKTLVRELHKAGIEVILDVVYNHTGEENELGPTLCFRGIDNQTYYALQGPLEQPYRFYRNNAGTGNILNIENPQVLKMVVDSLKYWVETMHVDGFRFDLATILGYKNSSFDSKSNFFTTIKNDPILKNVKLIAEPWDLTTYQQGNFPQEWAEWNGKFRDTIRRFWRGDPGQIKELAWRVTGSQDLFDDGRTPNHSINFVTCHDGFTLYDLYSYNQKHNEANGENNSDGAEENYSWNCGIEGNTQQEDVLKLRRQMVKNAVCCLLLSVGTPMILGGDEFLRSQQGNNNGYCQDNELSWFNWNLLEQRQEIYRFFKKAIAFRKQYPILRRDTFFSGSDLDKDNIPDVAWFDTQLKRPVWENPKQKILCYLFDGGEIPSEHGDYCLFFILNADSEPYTITLPKDVQTVWYRVVDTSKEQGDDFFAPENEVLLDSISSYQVPPRSFVVLFGKERRIDSSYFIG